MSVRLDNASTTGRPTYATTDNVSEQTVFTSTQTRPRILMCYLDMTNLTMDATIRVKVAVDGTNFRNLDSNDGRYPYLFEVSNDTDGVLLGPLYAADQVRVSYQAAVAEGASRSIPYHVVEHFLD